MATAPTATGVLSVEDLVTRGYFPDRVIPPVNALAMSPVALTLALGHVRPIAQAMLKKPSKKRSRCISHSVPKRKHLRRSLSIPNPFHYIMLSDEIANHWSELRDFCAKSPFALSAPVLDAERALRVRSDLNQQPYFRAARSVGARYLLKTDIARYYPSIYTHSIPWALHGKAVARADKKYGLVGNRLDLWMRETQDKQTGGIPIGSDASSLIGEIIGTALDLELQQRLPSLRGTRSIDDYYLYFDSIAEAESGLSVLHTVARQFELEINDPKTELIPLPEALEPAWKSELRSLGIRPSGQPQATDLLSLFDRAFEHSRHFPTDSVLTYAAKQVLSADISEDNWKFCEALLLRSAIAEPTMLSVLLEIYERYLAFHTDSAALQSAIEPICSYHAPLQQGNEVSWALWLARTMDVQLSQALGEKLAEVDDDIVALVTMDLIEHGNLNVKDLSLWHGHMTSANLYEDHWLLAYEAQQHGWRPASRRADYIASDPFFSILQNHDVRFYGGGVADTSSHFEYSEDDA